MSDYQLTSDPDLIQRLSDGAFIPNDNRNADWRTFMEWFKEDGNEPDPVQDIPAPVQPALSVDDLASILVKKQILTQDDISKK